MISTITKEAIKGVMEVVQTVRYNDGAIVRRLLHKVTGVPILILKKGG